MQAEIQKKLLSTKEVGRILGIHAATVRRECIAGRIPAIQVGKARQWRVPAAWLEVKLEPLEVDFSLEVRKDGTLIETRKYHRKGEGV